MNKQKAIDDCLQYVIDLESDDFKENPSKDHVYYSAIFALEGEDIANKELKQALKELKG